MAAFALLVFTMPSLVAWGQTRAEEVYSTCLFGSDYNQQSVGSYTATWTTTNGDFSWTIVNGNNNNNAWNYVKFGRKNNASVGEITTADAYGQAITRVDLTIDAITADKVNSIKLYTGSDNETWTEAGSFSKAAGLQTVTLANPAGSLYYKIEFDCASGSANGLVTVSKVEYYYNTGGAASPTITADNVEIAYDATSGDIEFTVNNPVEGGELSATTEAEWLTLGEVGEDAVPFTCTANEGAIRTATVTLTYTYGNDNVNKNVTVTQTANPNGPGSQANPYTVAQARAAIDAGTGTQGVYATGIVSAIPTAYSTQYSNITFNMIDEEGDEDFLQAFRCGGELAPEVAVGDVAVVYGNLTKYGSTYEFAQDCQVVSLTHPAVAVEAPTFSPAAGTYAEAQTVIISSETPDVDIYYTLDGTEPTMESAMYENPITVSETTTIKAIAVNGDDVASTVATANYYFCSANNPYTVTEALAFASYQYPANGIYVEGIVSTAPTQAPTNNGELTYYISVDGEATNELEVYKGKGMEQAAFTAQDDIQVGDIVTIYGNVQVYNGTIEFASGNYLVAFERPDAPVVPSITVNPATVSATSEGAEGTLTVTYENITEIDAEVYFCDANGDAATYGWITAEINGENNVEYLIEENDGVARTAYLKVYALDDNAEDVYSNLVTVNQAAYVAPALDYATLPFEFDGGRADIESTDGLTQEGLDTDYSSSPKLKFNTTGDWLLLHFNEEPGVLAFDIKGNGFSGGTFTVQTSVDGETYTDFATYTTLGDTEHETFNTLASDVRYIKWIYTEKSSGNVALGNIVLALPAPFISVEFDEIEVTATGEDDYAAITYGYLEIEDASDFGIQFFDAEGEELEEDPEWISAEVTTQTGEDGYFVYYVIEDNEGEARTAYFKVFAMGNEDFVYSNLVTISQEAFVAPASGDKYVKVSSTADLTDGQYLIVYEDGNLAFDGSLETLDAVGNTISVTISNNEIAATEAIAASEFTINTTDGTIQSASGYYIGQTSDANGLASSTETTYSNTISFDVNGNADIVSSEAHLRYNNASNQTRFRYYKSSSYTNQKAIQLYKKVEASESYELPITGYGTSNGGYYLIASPVTVNPASVEGMTIGDYDLYYFDQAEEDEWRNYKANPFNLVPGKGYLYAHKTDVTLTLTGTPYSGDGVIELDYTEGGDFPGWNLVGNPFSEEAYIDHDYYVMNEDGDNFIEQSAEDPIAPMQGIFVIADEDGENLTFTNASAVTGKKVVMNVTNNRSNVIDRAMIRFGEGRQLPKFQLNPNNTKLYIPQYESNYAVVRSENDAEMPVSFKAATNGTYTISISAENVDMEYMVLVDNLTGNETNLLETPSYTFEATTTDNANRFTLVYGVLTGVNEQSEGNFAFFNGNSWTISNNGNAILQVVDVTGRTISSETIEGSANVNLNQTPGVYMLRLVNGDNVKVQKVVVR